MPETASGFSDGALHALLWSVCPVCIVDSAAGSPLFFFLSSAACACRLLGLPLCKAAFLWRVSACHVSAGAPKPVLSAPPRTSHLSLPPPPCCAPQREVSIFLCFLSPLPREPPCEWSDKACVRCVVNQLRGATCAYMRTPCADSNLYMPCPPSLEFPFFFSFFSDAPPHLADAALPSLPASGPARRAAFLSPANSLSIGAAVRHLCGECFGATKGRATYTYYLRHPSRPPTHVELNYTRG